MKNVVILVSKDVLGSFNLPTYGNKYWNMPNVEKLAKNGTVFYRHYCAAPSTAMSFTSMFTGMYPYETGRKKYVHVKQFDKVPTFFNDIENLGYDIHIIWSPDYIVDTKPYSECFGNPDTVQFHFIDMNQPVGVHYNDGTPIVSNKELERKTVAIIQKEFVSIKKKEKQFIWIHIPHVIKGRSGYGEDMDVFDEIVGFLIERYGIDSIYLTGDHGHMNMTKNKICYGFDVYEPAVHIPLITPKIDGIDSYYNVTSNVDLRHIIFDERIVERDFVFSDCAYYAQPNRKLAIITNRYKYIYNKKTGQEELYDLEYDPNEEHNLAYETFYDTDRKKSAILKQVFFYPYWDLSKEALAKLRDIKKGMWREETRYEKVREIALKPVKKVYSKIKNNKHRKMLR